jgi:phage head maturation protease
VDDTGLAYDVDLPRARADVYELVQRGDVAKSSFAFQVIGEDGEEWGLTDQNYPQRTLLSVDLHDVAPVNAPAYLDTSSALRSLARHKDADVEEVRRSPLRASCASSSCGPTASPPKRNDYGAAARLMLLGRKTDWCPVTPH